MILDQPSLIINSRISDIKGFDSKYDRISEYYIDVVPECLDNHKKCIGEYTNHQLKTSFICYCKCHKKKISIDEIVEKINNNNNICLECGNDHNNNEYQNNKRKTSFYIFQEIMDNYTKNQSIKNRSLIEVIV